MDSTDENPLAFFEFIVNETNLSNQINNQLYYSDGATHFVNPETIGYVEENEFGEYIKHEIAIKDLMIPLLYRKYQQAKNNLNSFCFHNPQSTVENYVRIQFRLIQNIVNSQSELLNNNKYLLLPIRGLVNYINQVLSFSDMSDFELDERSITKGVNKEDDSLFDINQQSDSQVMHSVIDYMCGLNEKREQILNDVDFELLVKYTEELITKEEIPFIERQLKPKLSNGHILISYWTLHKELYTTKRIRPYFYDFIKAVFTSFNENEISSIKSQFGTKVRVYCHDFLPEIIKKSLSKE